MQFNGLDVHIMQLHPVFVAYVLGVTKICSQSKKFVNKSCQVGIIIYDIDISMIYMNQWSLFLIKCS